MWKRVYKSRMILRIGFAAAVACKSSPPVEQRPTPQPGSGAESSSDNCDHFCQRQASCMPTLINYNTCKSICVQQTANAPMMPHCFEAFRAGHACIHKLSCEELKAQIGLPVPPSCATEYKRFTLYCSQNVPHVSACLNDCDMAANCGEALDTEACALDCAERLQQLSIAQGVDCWNAASMALICKSTLSCRERKDSKNGLSNRCADRAQEQAAKCPLPR